MRAPDFDYRSIPTLDEAIAALVEHDNAVALAGGQSLIPMLRLRLARPQLVVDIGRIDGLRDVQTANGLLEMGALVTTAELEQSETVRSSSPLLAEASSVIADPLVRNAGTVGGNLAHADPLNDLPAVLVAGKGHVAVSGPDGERTVAADDLFAGPLTTTLRRGELITKVVVETSPAGAYEKLKRAAADYGVAAVAVQLHVDAGGAVARAGIAVTGAEEVAARATEAEETLVGTSPGAADIDRAAAAVAGAGSFTDDERGSARYKAALVEVLARSALTRALRRGVATRHDD